MAYSNYHCDPTIIVIHDGLVKTLYLVRFYEFVIHYYRSFLRTGEKSMPISLRLPECEETEQLRSSLQHFNQVNEGDWD